MTSERDVINSYLWIREILPNFKKWGKVGPPRLRTTSSTLSGHFPLSHMFVPTCALIWVSNYFTIFVDIWQIRWRFFCVLANGPKNTTFEWRIILCIGFSSKKSATYQLPEFSKSNNKNFQYSKPFCFDVWLFNPFITNFSDLEK